MPGCEGVGVPGCEGVEVPGCEGVAPACGSVWRPGCIGVVANGDGGKLEGGCETGRVAKAFGSPTASGSRRPVAEKPALRRKARNSDAL
jgi:hypothetical protein